MKKISTNTITLTTAILTIILNFITDLNLFEFVTYYMVTFLFLKEILID